MKRVLLLMVLMLMVLAVQAFSQATTSYDAAVTSASGPHASLFPAGQRVTVSYTLDPAATDSNSDPSRGLFHGAVLSLSISFPGLGIFGNGTSGLAQTFDNVSSPGSSQMSDQVFFHGGPISSASLLGGETITQIEVDFLSDFVCPPPVPSMLSSDALPLFRLPMTHSHVVLRTSTGTTFVEFAPHPRDRVQMLIDNVEALVAAGRLTRARADRLINNLEAAIEGLDRGNTSRACNNLLTFINRVNDLIDDGHLSRPSGQALIDAARNIREQIGC